MYIKQLAGTCRDVLQPVMLRRALLGLEGERAVDKVAQVGQQLAVVLGGQVGPLEVRIGVLWPQRQQQVAPDLQSGALEMNTQQSYDLCTQLAAAAR